MFMLCSELMGACSEWKPSVRQNKTTGTILVELETNKYTHKNIHKILKNIIEIIRIFSSV